MNKLSLSKNPDTIYITGNTVIDAMQHMVREDYTHPEMDWVGDDKLIFITAHRRENLGEPIEVFDCHKFEARSFWRMKRSTRK